MKGLAMSCRSDQVKLGVVVDASAKSEPIRKIKCIHHCQRCKDKRERKGLSVKLKAGLVSSLLSFVSVSGWAQNATEEGKSFWGDPSFPVYLIAAVVLILFILVVTVAILTIRVINVLTEQAAREKATRLGVNYVAEETMWSRWWMNANDLKPLSEEKTIELDHNYDGIRELDNHLPPWWKGLFYGSIVFAFIYLAIYHVFNILPLSEQEYENELAQADIQTNALKASRPAELIDENNLVFTNDAEKIGHGKTVFISNNCQSCHRNDGGGNIGPNLTDSYWIHGGAVFNIFSTIKNGVVEKAMPAWGKVMSQNDVRDVTFYIMSLQGTNPSNPKAPQGELYKAKPVTEQQDSTRVQAMMKK